MDYSKMQDLMKLQQQAAKIKKELGNIHIEAEVDWLVITVDWELKVVKVEFEDLSLLWNKEKLETAILEAVNKWMKKAQEVAADKMKDVMSWMGLNLPWM